MNNKRKLKNNETEESTKKMSSPPIFSIGQRGGDALLSQENREPLLVTDLHGYLQRLLTPWYQKTYHSSIGWCSLQNLRSLSKHLFIIVDGVSVSTFKDMHKGSKVADKCYRNRIASENDKSSEKIPQNEPESQNEVNDSEVEAPSENYTQTLKRWLPSLSTLTAVEVVSPALYNHELLQDLFYIKICAEPLVGPEVKTVPNIAHLNEQLKASPTLCESQCQTSDVPYEQNLYWKRSNKVSFTHSDQFDRTELCTSVELSQFYENSEEESSNFLSTKEEYVQVSPSSPLFAIDCEFVTVKINEDVLASIAIVNEAGEKVYSTLVMPSQPITDYKTKYSGITEEMLKDITVSLEDVQREIRENLPPDAILVGHSLSNDLNALKMRHPFVIDSSLIYNQSVNRTDKLKRLAKIFLGRDIQKESRVGHDPLEDAVAALDLVKLKLQHDEAFGDVTKGSSVPKLLDKEMKVVNIFDVRKTRKLENEALSVYCTDDNTKEWSKLLTNESRLVSKSCNQDLVSTVREESGDDYFIFVHLKAEEGIRSSKIKRRSAALFSLNNDLSALLQDMSSHCSISVLCADSGLDVPKEEKSNAMFLCSVR